MFDDLTDELRRYCEAHDLPKMSADELLCELWAATTGGTSAFVDPPATDARRQELERARLWLRGFIERWEAMETCERTGHTDTGRGVCADCGKFL